MKVIGLMSGTSVDSIDAALVEITGQGYGVEITLLGKHTADYPADLRDRILSVCGGHPYTMADIASMDDDIAIAFAQAANQLDRADLIASHGQTIYHRPPTATQLGYTWQLGRGELIANLTQTTTINPFRDADIAEPTAELTRNNILLNASVGVLAQANNQPSAAMRLINA